MTFLIMKNYGTNHLKAVPGNMWLSWSGVDRERLRCENLNVFYGMWIIWQVTGRLGSIRLKRV